MKKFFCKYFVCAYGQSFTLVCSCPKLFCNIFNTLLIYFQTFCLNTHQMYLHFVKFDIHVY